MKIGFVSLGCSKNLVDTEKMIGIFKKNDFEIVSNPLDAEMIIINTCGFIENSKTEAIDTILEMAKYKENKCKYLIVTGCLVERYKEDLEKTMPEVDMFIKFSEYENFWNKIETLLNKEKTNEQLCFMDRVITTGENYAFLRIAEGCSNRCSYCAIPFIRGNYVSRKMEDIISEAKKLANNGIKELIVIAQDTTKYGKDIYKEFKLPELLEELTKIEGIKWIRFLYSYPESITDELLKVVKENEKIVKYFDIPIQHLSDNVLKNMNRRTTNERITNIINKIRNEIPQAIIRTTLLVGFPGETSKDFKILYEGVKNLKFDKLGVFAYSKEEGTKAYDMKKQVFRFIKNKRRDKIMLLQREISKELLAKKVGKTYEMLVEGKSFDGSCCIGRTYMDVPEEDGIVYLKTNKEDLIGKFVKVEITSVKEYDLEAKLVE